MNGMSKYEAVAAAWRSRMLYGTEAEYRRALGVSAETLANNRASERDVEAYYGVLSRECEAIAGRELLEVMADFVRASELYRSVDWGGRTQLASRKRFCRMAFRLYATAGKDLSVDEVLRFKPRDDDKRLLDTLFPDGTAEAPAVDPGWLLLFAFGVVKPWKGGKGTRSHDMRDKDAEQSLRRMRELVETLRADIPRLGSTAKPMVFQEWLAVINSHLNNIEEGLAEGTPLLMITALIDIARACLTLVSTAERRLNAEQMQGYDMPGLWVDDADRGETRFWVFPDNLLGAFCYSRTLDGWQLTPYELRMRFSTDDDRCDTFAMLTPEGNLGYILNPDRPIPDSQIASGSCGLEPDPVSGEIARVELIEEPVKFPEWLNWRAWERLAAGDPRHSDFLAVLRNVYNPASPQRLFFQNRAPLLIDSANNLAGRDAKYLYLFDRRLGPFAIREHPSDRFTYQCASPGHQALFELPISEEQPLYALPLHSKKATLTDRHATQLADLLTDADNITELYLLHPASLPHPLLVSPAHSLSIPLTPATLAALGTRRLTHPLTPP